MYLLQVLQVAKTASADEIKSAYRKLALRYHPDKNQGANADEASQKFQIIVTAYGKKAAPKMAGAKEYLQIGA